MIADCRCGPNQAPRDGIPLCQRPYGLNREGFAVGEGPSFAGVLPWMPLGCGGPVQINSLNDAPVFVRSNGNLLVGQDGFSLVEYEPKSGNSVIISL